MSGTESCAKTEPSANSTKAWTIDWGWITTSKRSGGRPKSQRASITSNPLLIRVAQSTVMRSPIDQVGCFRTSSGVESRTVDGSRLRNGRRDPPHAEGIGGADERRVVRAGRQRDELDPVRVGGC